MSLSPVFTFGVSRTERNDTIVRGETEKSIRCPPVILAGRFRLKNRAELAIELGLNRSASDAEVIQIGWLRWKCDLADRLRGVFAFVVHDTAAQVLFAARDALGHEPLYLAACDSRWIFGDNPGIVRASMKRQAGDRPP